jgi:alanyl-tRNA synthetase
MKKLTGNEIREKFLQFFESKGHRRVRSSSLVPHGDPTLLFTNAGMNQFKDVFLGLEKREYTRATTAQKCVRAGGKHNDLENVGFTRRHHTFFEMLGNFSFGDYFKKDAIAYAWELITSPEWFGISKDKLYVTIFGGAEVAPGTKLGVDEEARKHWLEQHVAAERIFAIPGLKDNFWAMGDTGPCGPCSELHFDMGPAASDEGHTDCRFPCDCGRYVEIWNLVFMQFQRYCELEGFSEGGDEVLLTLGVEPTRPAHKHGPECLRLRPLPAQSVDTGMGLERVTAVMQGKISNYETDLFQPLIERAAELAKIQYGDDFKGDSSLQVIADHSRAATFLISDGVLPGRDRREYVLRKILRRAIRHGKLLGIEEPFIHNLVSTVVIEMEEAYPELTQSAERVSAVILREEKQFGRTLTVGWKKMEEAFGWLIGSRSLEVKELEANPPNDTVREIVQQPHTGQASELRRMTAILTAAGKPVVLPGDESFKLSDTFGVPRDFIEDSCRDMGVVFDSEGYEASLAEQRTRSKASWKGTHKEAANPVYAKVAEIFRTEPDFYYATTARDCRIEAIIKANALSSTLFGGESGEVVLDRTVIYAESGGQMTDTGAFYDSSESLPLAEVTGAYYPVAGLVAHKVTAKETLRVGDRVAVVADAERRARIMRNHSGTHLVHAALRNILGTHVKQAGSLNAPERLRFDFSHFAPVGQEELRDIEQQVNEEIRVNTQIETGVMSLEEALNSGALAFFGDKYPESNVRVVTIPDPRAPRGFYSKELCGGTHVHRIGDIGVLKIVSEESVAAGVRRIEAVTGIGALEHYQKAVDTLRGVAELLNVGDENILIRIHDLSEKAAALGKELGAQRRKAALGQLDELFAQAKTIKGVKVVCGEVGNVDRDGLRQLVDSLRQKLGSGVVVLGMPEDGKVALIAGVTKDLTAKVHAGNLIQALAKQVGGSGGGRPDLAEAGGKDTAALKNALENVPSLLEALL